MSDKKVKAYGYLNHTYCPIGRWNLQATVNYEIIFNSEDKARYFYQGGLDVGFRVNGGSMITDQETGVIYDTVFQNGVLIDLDVPLDFAETDFALMDQILSDDK